MMKGANRDLAQLGDTCKWRRSRPAPGSLHNSTLDQTSCCESGQHGRVWALPWCPLHPVRQQKSFAAHERAGCLHVMKTNVTAAAAAGACTSASTRARHPAPPCLSQHLDGSRRDGQAREDVAACQSTGSWPLPNEFR
jgi:hypothetical protein